MASATTIDAALIDRALLGAALGDASSWQTWRAVLSAAFGLELNRDEARAFASVAGSRASHQRSASESCGAIIGRRGGKSLASRQPSRSISPSSSSIDLPLVSAEWSWFCPPVSSRAA